MDGKEYKGEGDSVYDAISNIPLDWTQIKTKGTIKVSQGKKKAEKLFYAQMLKAIFASKMRRMAWAKNLNFLLNS